MNNVQPKSIVNILRKSYVSHTNNESKAQTAVATRLTGTLYQ